MKSPGSIYVSVVFAALAGYFTYQWWFNPNRIIKARLGEVASALSAPAAEEQVARLARLARLRRCLAGDLHVQVGRSGPAFSSRDEALGAAAAWNTATGLNLDFVDVNVRVNPDDTARAFATAEMTSRDSQSGQQTLDAREVVLSLVKQEGDWVIRDVEVKDLPDAR